jgi:hypothetical protein
MRPLRFLLCSVVLFATSSAALAAGTVKVNFVEPQNFTDVRGTFQRVDDNALKTLAAHFESSAGRYVPDGQTLNVDVIDVDLAGEFRPRLGAFPEVRVLGKGADSPHLTFRYSLSSPSGAAPLAEVRLSDLSYLYRGYSASSGESLRYEKRMIDEWVGRTLASK